MELDEKGKRERKSLSPEMSPYEINAFFTKNKAKELYIVYFWEIRDLHDHLGIPESTLYTWINKSDEGELSWAQERRIFEASVMRGVKEKCGEEIGKAFSRAMSVMNRSLAEMNAAGMTYASPRDLRDMVTVLQSLKNLVNVEQGKPTDIKETVIRSQKDVQVLLAELQELDPLLDYSPKDVIN